MEAQSCPKAPLAAACGAALILLKSSNVASGFVSPGGVKSEARVESRLQRQAAQAPLLAQPRLRGESASRYRMAISGTFALGLASVTWRRRRGTQRRARDLATICFAVPKSSDAASAEPVKVQRQSCPSKEAEKMLAALAVASAALVASDPAHAAEAVTDVAGALAEAAGSTSKPSIEEMGELITAQDEGDWFEPLVKFNAGIIAGIDDLVEDGLKIPNSFGFAIIFYTAVIKLLTYPLNANALRTGAIMQLVKPKIDQIQRKYKNDQETQNRMLLRLYDDCGVNPLGGCLPSLLQVPIFIALYRSINKLAEVNPKFREPFLWIPSLAGPIEAGQPNLDWLLKSKFEDHFEPMVGWDDAAKYCVLPAMLVVSQFVTQQISNPQGGAQGGPAAALTGIFPIIIGYSTLVSPQGIGIYWLFNNLITQGSTYLIRNQLGEEFPEYKAMLDNQKKPTEEKKEPAEEKQEEATRAGKGFGGFAPTAGEIEEEAQEEEPEVVTTTTVKAPQRRKSDGDYKRQAKKLANKRRRR